MSDLAPWSPADKRRTLTALGLTALALGFVATHLAPFRVADCGPADPALLRYLGGAVFHSTGDGVISSLERRIWAGPYALNVALATAFVLACMWASNPNMMQSRPPYSKRVQLILLAVGVLTLWVVLAALLPAVRIEWTLTGPPVTPEACGIRFDFNPDTRAWVAPSS
ncbi:hypothetical protein [Gymnodinialimonas ulvae]|uniref:hypothetical protein n=1 Tax=Gymnodinialimonas ulvae TaxID=3126504 RepID=UPI0030A8F803